MSIKIITGEKRCEGREVCEGLKNRRILPNENIEAREKTFKMYNKMICKMKEI